MRPLPLLLALVATASLAQGRPAHPATVPSAKEEAPPASTPACPPSAEDDVALLRGLLAVSQPAPEDVRVLAVEDLALLGDARALNPLALLVFDPSPAVQRAAIAAISRFRTPRAAEILANTVRHPRTAELLKLQALEALPFQRDAVTRAFLEQVAHSPRHSTRVQSAARLALQRWMAPAASASEVTP